MSIKALQEYTFTAKYAQWLPKKNRRETWNETVNRVKKMMLEKYADKPEVHSDIEWAYEMMRKRRILGSQRALQFGGPEILRHNMKIYNCFDVATEFVTENGVKSFLDFSDGDSVVVLTHAGNWKNAVVRQYGEDRLYKVSLSKNNFKTEVLCTKNHRWLLANGDITTDLKVGDKLLKQETIFHDFNYDEASFEEKLYWCYGFVYGDGTITQTKYQKYSLVRLCGKDANYEYRFNEVGFKSSTNLSLKGDVFCYTGKYQKTSPDPEIDSPELIRAFVRGYLDADGTKNLNPTGKLFTTIQSSDKDHIDFIRKCFPVAGVFIMSEKELTGQKTNFGVRPYTIQFTLCDHPNTNSGPYFTVESIKQDKVDKTWCLEVEDDQSFVLPCGVPTGNCISSYIDRPEFFGECMYLLLCGCGTGFSVQKHHVAKLPKIITEKGERSRFAIEDSIEGWSDAISVIVNSYFQESHVFSKYCGTNVEFDFTKIRPEGSPIGTSGRKAPGPEPLKRAIAKIRKVLDNAIARCNSEGIYSSRQLKPIEVYDIVMHAADAVISGGVRRSATICIFSADDEEMAKAKTGNWFNENPQRGRSNNSALLLRNTTSREDFNNLMKMVKEFGEPGFVWSDSTELVVNPCVEIGMYAYTNEGKSGWQACNLSTINCSKVKTAEDFYEAAKAAAIIGTLQAGFTDVGYLTNESKLILERESLLGVSGTGWMENPEICLDPMVQQNGAKIVVKTNEMIAKLIGINPAARATCVKPEGTSSTMLGTSSGIHPHHAKRYIRHVQANKNEEVYQYFKSINPRACERSVWSANDSDEVISFCVEIPNGAKTKNQVNAISLLDFVKSTQQNWVIPGKVESRCTQKWLVHNVSNTINVKPDEWDGVEEYIYNNREWFCGISLLPVTGDKDYPQAPFTTIYLPSEMLSYYGDGVMFVSGLIEKSLQLFDDNLWAACDSIIGLSGPMHGKAKEELKTKCEKFAVKYFEGDVKRLTYAMKDVYNYKLWTELNREYQDVDYEHMVETENNVEVQPEWACAGGSCSI